MSANFHLSSISIGYLILKSTVPFNHRQTRLAVGESLTRSSSLKSKIQSGNLPWSVKMSVSAENSVQNVLLSNKLLDFPDFLVFFLSFVVMLTGFRYVLSHTLSNRSSLGSLAIHKGLFLGTTHKKNYETYLIVSLMYVYAFARR